MFSSILRVGIVFGVLILLGAGCARNVQKLSPPQTFPASQEQDYQNPPEIKPEEQPKELWRYLEKLRRAQVWPTPTEIEQRFGKPQEIMEWEELASSSRYVASQTEYRRFTLEERARRDYVPMLVWRYHWKGDQNRYIDVVIRKREGALAGWSWFENVPSGQELGLPQ